MKTETRQRLYNALTTAAQMIEEHIDGGLEPDDVGEIDEDGLEEYNKACFKASKMIMGLSKKYETKRK